MVDGRKLYMLRFACGHIRGVISAVELDAWQQEYLAAGQCGHGQCEPRRELDEWDKDESQSKTPEQERRERMNARAREYYHANKEKKKAINQRYRQANKEKIRAINQKYRQTLKEARL